mmetsp:Transcript_34587/g.33794  ORF Transcript_34587/g.33794 Transcript_34587/m.33794 type:complete len:104 (-) Transcript_34587:473-784(-)
MQIIEATFRNMDDFKLLPVLLFLLIFILFLHFSLLHLLYVLNDLDLLSHVLQLVQRLQHTHPQLSHEQFPLFFFISKGRFCQISNLILNLLLFLMLRYSLVPL